MSLEGKVAIITGAARGLGGAYALGFARAGSHVVAVDILDCGDTLAAIEEAGGRGLGLTCDITNMVAVQSMAERAMEEFGHIDVLVNNAALYGALTGGRFDEIAERDWDACMTVNVKGMWHCCRAVVPAMRAVGGGAIINISSLAATYGAPFALHYTTSKAAVIGLTRGLARELGRDNIRVNAIAPAVVETEGTEEFFGEPMAQAVQAIVSNQSLRRVLTPNDLVGAVLFLASEASMMVTGQTLAVDGGTVFL
jgi:3-oxoacyl-[acyl-carrier protein] reductase